MASVVIPVILQGLIESGASVVARRPPVNAPTENAASAVRERHRESPGAHAAAKRKEHDVACHVGSENMPKAVFVPDANFVASKGRSRQPF